MLFFGGNNTLFKPKAGSNYCSNIEVTHIKNSHTETWFVVLCLCTTSQCVSSQASVRNTITGNKKKKKPLHTQKPKIVIWQWLQQSLSQSLFVVMDIYVPVHMCRRERACEPRNTRIYMFCLKPGYKQQVESHKTVCLFSRDFFSTDTHMSYVKKQQPWIPPIIGVRKCADETNQILTCSAAQVFLLFQESFEEGSWCWLNQPANV